MKYKNKINKKIMIQLILIIYNNKNIWKNFYNINNYFINIAQEYIK